jgi:hypothetical protein
VRFAPPKLGSTITTFGNVPAAACSKYRVRMAPASTATTTGRLARMNTRVVNVVGAYRY